MISTQTRVVGHYLDYLAQRQRLTASNLANIDTPGYRTRDLDFSAALKSALADPSGQARAGADVVGVDGLEVKTDGNDVSLDRELRNLSETAVRFSHALLIMRKGFSSVRSAIHEGRGGGA